MNKDSYEIIKNCEEDQAKMYFMKPCVDIYRLSKLTLSPTAAILTASYLFNHKTELSQVFYNILRTKNSF